MKEHLLYYIENKEKRLIGLQEELDRYIEDENYILASEIKGMLFEIKMSIYHLSRIINGLSAFDEPTNNVFEEIKRVY